MGYVYVIKQIDGDYYKIGLTRNPKQRLKTLEHLNGGGIELKYIIATEICEFYEQLMHSWFKGRRVNGEWFLLEDIDLKRIENFFENIASDGKLYKKENLK